MNQVHEFPAALQDRRVVFDLVSWIAHRSDEDVFRLDLVILDGADDLRFVVIPVQRVEPAVEKSLDPPWSAASNGLGGPGKRLTPEFSSVDDYEVLFHMKCSAGRYARFASTPHRSSKRSLARRQFDSAQSAGFVARPWPRPLVPSTCR